MKSIFKTIKFFAAVWMLSATTAVGQTFLGSASYYRIMNCDKRYAGRCIQDSITSENKTQWHYIVTSPDMDNTRQQWELIRASTVDTTAFYIRNRASYRYIYGNAKAMKVRSTLFYLPQYVSTRLNASVWHFIRLTNGQYVITTTDSYGVDRFLSACDSTRVPTKFWNIAVAGNTAFAWYVVNADTDITSINDAPADKDNIGVGVVNRHIIVYGTDDYRIYDTAGRRQPENEPLPEGCYIVTAGGKSHKIIIR